MENCLKFRGINITYQLAVADNNVSANMPSCYAAISIAQSLKDMSGVLYVNDTEALRRPECQDLQYIVIAQEQQKQLQASSQILIVLDAQSKHSPEFSCNVYCHMHWDTGSEMKFVALLFKNTIIEL